jgi:hypothetical protein
MKETKAFFKTSEFWLMVLGQAVLLLQDSGVLNLMAEKYNWIAPILQVILASSYITSRGHAKSGIPAGSNDEPLPAPTYPETASGTIVEPGTNIAAP